MLGGEIWPGSTLQGTAGYLVPETMVGPEVTWHFCPRAELALWASATLAYEPPPPSERVERYEVAITDAFLNRAGDTWVIEGEILNLGTEALIVEWDDINFTSSAGVGELLMTAPSLPWTIYPNQAQVIEFQYVKPNAPTALLTVLGYAFEIGGGD